MYKKTKNIFIVAVVLFIVALMGLNVYAKTTIGVSLLTREHVYYNFLEEYL